MTLKDFTQTIDSTILQRGRQYFGKGYVENLAEENTGHWTADVQGTELYEVSITVSARHTITAWECDCPYDGPVCKHVAAVLYAITEASAANPVKGKTEGKNKSAKHILDSIFAKTSKEDLVHFLTLRFKADKSLQHTFLAHFAELNDEDADKKYHTLIQNIYRAARGRDGYIDYYSAKKLALPLLELIQKAEELLAEKNITEPIAIGRALLEHLPSLAENMDDSDGDGYGIMEATFGLFHSIIAQAPPMLKDDLFDYFLDAYAIESYHRNGIGHALLNVLASLVSDKGQEKKFFGLIDTEIAKKSQKDSASYQIQLLLDAKINYLKTKNRAAEVQGLMEQHRNHPNFRESLIREALQKKEYEVAKTLCLEGVGMARERNHYGTLQRWKKILLEIAVLQQTTLDIRALAEELFISSHGTMDYYYTLKATYDADEWTMACTRLVNSIKKRPGAYINTELFCARIFAAERDAGSLIRVLQKHAANIEFVNNYAEYVRKEYPEELLACYEKGIAVVMQQTGRGYYELVAKYLLAMHLTPGGKEKSYAIIAQLREQYKQRKAMHAVLDKVFPETAP